METGNDGQRSVGFDDKDLSVRKAAEQGPADVLVDDRKLLGIGTPTLNHGANRRAEALAQTGNLILVPSLRIDQLGAGRQGKGNGIDYRH